MLSYTYSIYIAVPHGIPLSCRGCTLKNLKCTQIYLHGVPFEHTYVHSMQAPPGTQPYQCTLVLNQLTRTATLTLVITILYISNIHRCISRSTVHHVCSQMMYIKKFEMYIGVPHDVPFEHTYVHHEE